MLAKKNHLIIGNKNMKTKQLSLKKKSDRELIKSAEQLREKRIQQLQNEYQADKLLEKYSSEKIVDKLLADSVENDKIEKIITQAKGKIKLREIIDRYLAE
jgi:hypothetical protein